MDATKRGIIDKLIDNFVFGTSPHIEGLKMRFEPIIENPEDLTLGFYIGYTYASFIGIVEHLMGGKLTDDEANEAFDIIERRATELKDSILKTQ